MIKQVKQQGGLDDDRILKYNLIDFDKYYYH